MLEDRVNEESKTAQPTQIEMKQDASLLAKAALLLYTSMYRVLDLMDWCLAFWGARNGLNKALYTDVRYPCSIVMVYDVRAFRTCTC